MAQYLIKRELLNGAIHYATWTLEWGRLDFDSPTEIDEDTRDLGCIEVDIEWWLTTRQQMIWYYENDPM